jgi:hypothetical protein
MHGLKLSVAALNFRGIPDIPDTVTLQKLAAIGFETCDNFNWRDPVEFAAYKESLPQCHLGAGVLVVNKIPDRG